MFDVDIQYWAVLVAAVVMYLVGMVWYMALSKPWMKAAGFEGMTKEQMKEQGGIGSYLGSFLTGFVLASVLAHIIKLVGADSVPTALTTGFWVWIGFVATTSLKSFFWEKRTFRLWLINNGDHLLGILIASVLLVLWA